MNRVAIKAELLMWAQERAGLPDADMAKKFPAFAQWVTGKAAPTIRQLEKLATATLTPLGYFFLPQPPEDRLPIPHFRTMVGGVPRRPSPELIETVQVMQRRQAWMRDFLVEQGQPALPFVGSAAPRTRIPAVAAAMREALKLNVDWARRQGSWTAALDRLRDAVEEAGILVSSNGVVGNNTGRKLAPDEFRGFVLTDEFAPLVFINGADWKSAQMFTLAHEIAHVWFARSAAFDLRGFQPADDAIEQACNQVAAEFLVPEAELRSGWTTFRRDAEPFQAIARVFKISPIVAARRALDCGLITKDQFFAFLDAYDKDERRLATKKKASGGDFYATQNSRLGRRFADAVFRAAKEGRLLYREAYALTGLRGSTFDKYAVKLGLAQP